MRTIVAIFRCVAPLLLTGIAAAATIIAITSVVVGGVFGLVWLVKNLGLAEMLGVLGISVLVGLPMLFVAYMSKIALIELRDCVRRKIAYRERTGEWPPFWEGF